MDKIRRHSELCAELKDLYILKNNAYGDSFSKTFRELGPISAVTRMNDKMERIKSLVKGSQENDEKLTETLRDLINYGIMYIMEIEEKE